MEHKRKSDKQIQKVNDGVIIDDSIYVIMTEDKKCIIRGRKTSKLVLSTLDENCGNYKLFTCRQSKVMTTAMNSEFRKATVYLTDNVRQLYGTNSSVFKSDENIPKLIGVKAQVQYKIQL